MLAILVMVRWFNVDCSQAEGFYFLNDEIAAEREANSPSDAGGLLLKIIIYSYQSSSSQSLSPKIVHLTDHLC